MNEREVLRELERWVNEETARLFKEACYEGPNVSRKRQERIAVDRARTQYLVLSQVQGKISRLVIDAYKAA